MKRFLSIILSLIFLLTIAQDSHAQFWKRKSKRNTTTTNQQQNQPADENDSSDNTESIGFLKKKRVLPDFPVSEKKEVYRVDLLLPLNLNKTVINGKPISQKNMPEATVQSVNFYEGVLIAGDSMASRNFKLDLHVHDISDPVNSVYFLLRQKKLEGTDLIIGLLQSNDISLVAGYAKSQKVNFLSALSPSDAGLKNNPYFIMIQPTLGTHVQKILDFVDRKHKRNPKFLLYRDSSYADDAANMVKAEFQKSKKFMELKYNNDEDFQTIQNEFSKDDVNVIYCTILDTRIAYSLLKKLSEMGPAYKFEVFGMPSWKVLPHLDVQQAYPNLSIYYTTPFYYDRNTGPGVDFLKKYKRYDGSSTGEFAFRGYELMFWMCHLLEQYGAVFNQHFDDISNTLFTRYDIRPEWDAQNELLYFENKKLHILQFENGNMRILD
jgi:hypothetical protein